MKLRIILIAAILLILFQNSAAQTDYRGKIEIAVAVSQTEWNIKFPVVAKVTVKNISSEPVKINLGPNFKLTKKGVSERDKGIAGNDFSSDEKKKDTRRKQEKNVIYNETRQWIELSLNDGESKTVEFEVSKLGWCISVSSDPLYENWYEAIPKGEYEFYYALWVRLGEVEGTSRTAQIFSNKIEVKLNSKK